MSQPSGPEIETPEEALERRGPIATPAQSIEAINKVVSVLFTYKRPAMYKDVAIATNLHEMVVSQALSAARDMGLTTSGGKKGLYVLTSDGTEYARLLTAGKENEAKLFLSQLLAKQPTWKEIITFLSAIRGEAREPLDLVLDVERKLNKTWSPSMRNRLRDCFVSILTYAGFIQKEGGKMFSLISMEEPLKERPVEVSIPAPEQKPLDFALLQTDDFRFEIRKNLDVLAFAKAQFLAWLEYLEKTISQETSTSQSRQSDGGPNQQP
mgnify:CR=1 FL=1